MKIWRKSEISMLNLKNKVVFITGASTGVGLELAKQLVEQGAKIILTARNEEKLEKARVATGISDSYLLDVRSSVQIDEVITKVIQKYGKIDYLINNAGFGIFNEVVSMEMEEVEELMDVNYFGVVRCTKAVLPYMLERNEGHIINIASVAGKIASAKAAAYSASKSAVIGFSNGLRAELKSSNVYVSVINPGPIDTPFFNRADPTGSYVKNVNWFMLDPEKVAYQIIKVMMNKKMEINLPLLAGIGIKLFHLFPKTFDLLVGKHLNKK